MLRGIARRIVIVAAVAGAVVWTTYVASRLYTTYDLQTRLTRVEVEVLMFKTALAEGRAARDERLDYLERYVYGDLPASPTRTIVITPQWQKVRDQEIRNQIQALQRRLSSLERE